MPTRNLFLVEGRVCQSIQKLTLSADRSQNDFTSEGGALAQGVQSVMEDTTCSPTQCRLQTRRGRLV